MLTQWMTAINELVYVRYADDFLIGGNWEQSGRKASQDRCGKVYPRAASFELSQEKTLITHGTDFAQFLSFQITTSKEQNSTRTKAGYVKRPTPGVSSCMCQRKNG